MKLYQTKTEAFLDLFPTFLIGIFVTDLNRPITILYGFLIITAYAIRDIHLKLYHDKRN